MHVASASMINKLEKHENSSAEKINLFGELFYENPKQFTFLSGERSSIISAVELCASILKENKIPVLQVNSMFRKHSSVASSLAATRPQLAIDTTKGNAQQFLTSSNAAGMNQLPISKGRSLLEAASNNWVQRFKQTNNLNYTLEDFTVCEETRKIVCEHKDHFKATTIRMVFDDKGYWKISNFSRHVTDYHSALKPTGPSEENIVNVDIIDTSNSDGGNIRNETKTNGNKETVSLPPAVAGAGNTKSTDEPSYKIQEQGTNNKGLQKLTDGLGFRFSKKSTSKSTYTWRNKKQQGNMM
ncbi:hypothetical protein OUZ56_021284 [Daphnia magna]|uniref:Uncharacterized protein n=1 Tax=Daphnia magna TaxID=35525 RepID=A0ABQ9ZH01_9CRUS|nr:hypothetical protein OUZ56_021284 [Daphnia magna]